MDPTGEESSTSFELNLARDPGERDGLAGTEAKRAGELLVMLRIWRKHVSARMMSAKWQPPHGVGG